MKRYLLLFCIPCVFIIPIIVYETSEKISRNEYSPTIFLKRSVKSIACDSLLIGLNTSVPVLLIDLEILESLENGHCSLVVGKPVKIGVSVEYLSENGILEDERFEVSYYSNDSTKDYLDFRTEPRKIIPKNFATYQISNLNIPANFSKFSGFWQRAKFLDCMNLYIPRAGMKARMHARPATKELAKLRDELIEAGMFPFLNGGTLLGWYRECSVIPHTSDMDLAVLQENYKPQFLENVERNSSQFRLSRKLGMINDSFEMTVAVKEGYQVHIDIFVMYKGVENGKEIHWVGGLAPDGTKYKYTYPLYDPWCSADLHGRIFWVTCTPNDKLVKEYGQLWYRDHLTSKFSWSSSGKNVRKNGKWTKEQMKTAYNVY